ncbi:hypothetical protein [Pseudotabrizicola algicola]|uniref:ACT domain-containing protein n=1 Tax=Pseudotabrizicola algicola TaxID=2709381 RepID=A0A6B3RSL2_9RHOB|nr:hypothetical protein [Pseudotabrizicola algicola]NEX46985.1 hypothetical protein [Pseudotabrizicola algicola]
MRDTLPALEETGAQIPLADIARSRADFPAARMSFHLELVCAGLTGLGALCLALGRAGLELRSLRVGDAGRVSCVLAGDGTADLTGLALDLPQVAALRRWTTQLEF